MLALDRFQLDSNIFTSVHVRAGVYFPERPAAYLRPDSKLSRYSELHIQFDVSVDVPSNNSGGCTETPA
jgi:hypothetical protein